MFVSLDLVLRAQAQHVVDMLRDFTGIVDDNQ